jgi:GH24 family phage-related lysozyme (muramidase)
MTTSEQGRKQIEELFGIETEPYQDPWGVYVIGMAHPYNFRGNITVEQARAFLVDDLAAEEVAVKKAYPRELSQGLFDALVLFEFRKRYV